MFLLSKVIYIALQMHINCISASILLLRQGNEIVADKLFFQVSNWKHASSVQFGFAHTSNGKSSYFARITKTIMFKKGWNKK